ncbi:hypothetical protein [Halobacillus sp. A5]|uniref:hypothetical protein n=1 Tax=Halobacillus sp. A5 TaxID=2880263 RepID=UPI0020A66259|nr:hypothetical protein [Halobacillus sp. A5]MCP3028647.1 hypothetical protein [Halobacillus sp. A5]
MTGSVELYVNQFKSYIMNGLISSVPPSLGAAYEQLKEEIGSQDGCNHELKNLDQAYELVHKEISGRTWVSSRK